MVHIIINPVAGSGHCAHVGEQAIQRLKQEKLLHGVSYTEHVGHATQLARQAALAGASSVAVVGGDGTVREAVEGLLETNAALGIIPAGTGNDAAKMLGLPKNPMDALSAILSTPARPVDVGSVNNTVFFNVCGTGFDVCVLDYSHKAKKYARGMLPYLFGVLRTIFTFAPNEIQVSIDEGPEEVKKPLIIAIANGNCFGGGITIAPNAYPDDGLFDVIMVDAMPRSRMPFQLPKLVTGRASEISGYQMRRCRSIALSAKGLRIQIDGEIAALEKAEIKLMPRALIAHW